MAGANADLKPVADRPVRVDHALAAHRDPDIGHLSAGMIRQDQVHHAGRQDAEVGLHLLTLGRIEIAAVVRGSS